MRGNSHPLPVPEVSLVGGLSIGTVSFGPATTLLIELFRTTSTAFYV